ncbi:NAD-dependent epimerase/dehydratase family protein [Rhodococcus tibetensis]|uniref:NAD-dependent epimerase/dehydratase family protein n=1 Tax=Rhodococcus tibetensis TaxID=2965064 RepID=A0ABT1QJU2_9NOCA|nr:NAD-dependent epimerase/dehydratase family protein [Rhodococcus sp. FXJ9.536]MCQ4122516.1 NAD-dependent epimerase/dehydratase family protein [Rhodococcus sp. FXJ9.536]
MSEDQGLKVVVVGATGNVGTSIVEALSGEPAVREIVGVARRHTDWTCSKTRLMFADSSVDDFRPLVRGADAVVHLAWLFQPTRKPDVTWMNNVLGAIRVFEAAAEERVPALVYASSVAAYSPGPSDTAVTEDWPTHGWPGAAYPREKAYLERWLDTYELRNPDMRVVRMRPGFIFKRESATAQRRLFVGPLLAGRLVRAGLIPAVPAVEDLRAQILHSTDVAAAFVRAVLRPVRGAFNIAADPPVDSAFLAELLGARQVSIPRPAIRGALWAAWHAHAVPASPGLLDTVLHLPIMDTTRARTELGWQPRLTPRETLEEFLGGLRDGAGMPTPPLQGDTVGGRLRELATGIGQRP